MRLSNAPNGTPRKFIHGHYIRLKSAQNQLTEAKRTERARHNISEAQTQKWIESIPLLREQFIQRATDLHTGRYDYSQFEYGGMGKPGIIICPIDGPFRQTPTTHLYGNKRKGSGCPRCALRMRRENRADAQIRMLELWANPEYREQRMKPVPSRGDADRSRRQFHEGDSGLYHYLLRNGWNGPLTEEQVLSIRADERPQSVIAGVFGIATQTVSNIKNRKSYGWVESPPSHINASSVNRNGSLTEEQVLSIRADKRLQRIIAADFGITQVMVGAIKRRNVYRWIEGPPSHINPSRAIRHGTLSETQVLMILADERPQSVIAAEVGITQTQVSRIKRRKIYRYVGG